MNQMENKHSEGVIRRCKDIHRQVDTTITERRERPKFLKRWCGGGGGERTNGIGGGGNCMAVNGRVGSESGMLMSGQVRDFGELNPYLNLTSNFSPNCQCVWHEIIGNLS